MKYFAAIVSILLSISGSAQENIPLGEWRVHVSYNKIVSVTSGSDEVFAAAANGIVVVNKSDHSYNTYNKLNRLTRTGISIIDFHQPTKKLLVAYDNGSFDMVAENEVRNLDPSENTVLTGPKQIHDISFHDQLAYLSTDYGVLLFDLQRSEIKETWRDLGVAGSTLQIFGSTFSNDSIFLATADGVMAGDLDDNLLDFNKWKRMASGELNDAVNFIATLDDKPYAAINGVGIFVYEDYAWVKSSFLIGQTFSSFQASEDHIVITQGGNTWKLAADGSTIPVSSDLITGPLDAIEDANGKMWIGDLRNGLLTDQFGSFESIVPNGPATDLSYSLTYADHKMYLVAGGFSGETALQNDGVVSFLEKGLWMSTTETIRDLTAIQFRADGAMFISSFGYGVLDKSSNTLYDESNSTLINTNPPARNVKITDLHYSTDGLWAANYGTTTSLHLLNNENQWEAFTIPFSSARYPQKLITDFEGNVWMLLNPSFGGGLAVFNKLDNESIFLTEEDANGELPSNSVYSLALDRDGYVLSGTDAGVAYFYDESSDAVKPIFENRFLLRDDKVTSIAVDGGNRKWMGTERGVWLFNPTGEVAIANFTSANSPLLSDVIHDIEIDPVTGEVFFATDKGLISYRADATTGSLAFDGIRIFPNPVLQNFMGEVGISGLASDAIVKITDVSGRLVFQTTANGGTASWNVRDHQGRRVQTGVFLVLAVTSDGSESVVGKIAVIN